jgi:hypothetical protein
MGSGFWALQSGKNFEDALQAGTEARLTIEYRSSCS